MMLFESKNIISNIIKSSNAGLVSLLKILAEFQKKF